MATYDFMNLDEDQKVELATQTAVAFELLKRQDMPAVYILMSEVNRTFGPHAITFFLFQLAHRGMTMNADTGKRAHLRFGTTDGRIYTTDGIDTDDFPEDQQEVVGDAIRVGRFVEAAGAREMMTCVELFAEASFLPQARVTGFISGVLNVTAQIVQGAQELAQTQRANLN